MKRELSQKKLQETLTSILNTISVFKDFQQETVVHQMEIMTRLKSICWWLDGYSGQLMQTAKMRNIKKLKRKNKKSNKKIKSGWSYKT